MDCGIQNMNMSNLLVASTDGWLYTLRTVNNTLVIEEYNDVDSSMATLQFANGITDAIDNCRRAVYGYDQRQCS